MTGRSGSHGHGVWIAILAVACLAMSGCDGDDGNDGAPGTAGADGLNCWDLNGNGVPDFPDEDTNGDGVIDVNDCRGTAGDSIDLGNLDDETIEEIGTIVAEITGVTVSSPPVMTFTLASEDGTPLVGLPESAISATFVKLVPAANNQPSYWASYINRIEEAIPGHPVSPNVLDLAKQATTDGGTLVDNGNGSYTFTYNTDVANVTDPVAVAYEPSLTHRAGFEIRLEDEINPDNPTFDFVPDGGAGSGSKDIAALSSCNNCHERLAIHGDGRFTTTYCTTCHLPGTRDQDFGEMLDMAHMSHAVHASEMREDRGDAAGQDFSYIVYGFGERFNADPDDYSEVTYPQDVLYCTNCHEQNDEAPDGDDWETVATSEACGACHIDGLNASAPDANTGLSTYTFIHLNVNNFEAGNDQCTNCHNNSGGPGGYTPDQHIVDSRVAAEAFDLTVISAQDTGPNQQPIVTYSVTDPTNGDAPYDIVNDDEFTSGSSSLALRFAWPTTDYSNEGSGVADATSGPPGQPFGISLSTLQTDSTQNQDGSYTVLSSLTTPADVSGSMGISIEGHPAGDFDGDGTFGDRVPAEGSVEFFSVTDSSAQARRAIVDIAKCNDCHEYTVAHGANRNNDDQLCAVCHTPDATDIRRREQRGVDWNNPDPDDGRGEDTVAFSTMAHGIHAANVVLYGFSGAADFTEVTYPGRLSNCNACHINDSYYGAGGDARPITTGTGAIRNDWRDDEATTATTAACYSCHKGSTAAAHMQQNGGYIADGDPATVETYLKVDLGGSPDTQEACGICHGPGGVADVGEAHGVSE